MIHTPDTVEVRSFTTGLVSTALSFALDIQTWQFAAAVLACVSFGYGLYRSWRKEQRAIAVHERRMGSLERDGMEAD